MNLLKAALLCLVSWVISGCAFASEQILPTLESTAIPDPNLPMTVAWISEGDLFLWTALDSSPRQIASENIVAPYLSPTGANIAFIRQIVGVSDSLWLIDPSGNDETQLFNAADLNLGADGQFLIGQVAWWDETTLYFNTQRQTGISLDAQNDLYRVDISTDEVTTVLAAGEGGRLSFSPVRTWIAVIHPGTYDETDGRIQLIDPSGQNQPRELFAFPAVATGSHNGFYPDLHWLDDDTLLVAIPDPDLIYSEASEDAPPVMLWRLEINGQNEQIGEVQASLFGLPRWSDDGAWMTYLRREDSANHFALVVAAGDGSNPQLYDSSEAGTLLPALWLPDENRFIYAKEAAYWFGTPGEDSSTPERWVALNPAAKTLPRLIGEFAIYLFLNEQTLELRYANIYDDADSSVLIASFASIPVYDVIPTETPP